MNCVACSIFSREIQALRASGRFTLPVEYLSSMLHMVPDELETRLRLALQASRARDPEAVMIYGDCCGHMEAFAAEPATARTEGINCCEIVLGRETYRKLRREGAFFLMPEWTLAWRRIFEETLGLLGPCAKAFMQEMHTRLIYLDTGVLPVPHRELGEAGAYMGLPVEILPVSLEPLLASLMQAARTVHHD